MSPKRTFNQVPAKTALVLTGSAIAVAAYLGASSSDTGHDGCGARQTSLAAALTASHQAPATATLNGGTADLGGGLESTSTSSTSQPGPMTLAAYGTAQKHPQPGHKHPTLHQKHHPGAIRNTTASTTR